MATHRHRLAALALGLALAAPPAHAQSGPQLDIWVHASIVGVRSPQGEHPQVRLIDPAGRLKARAEGGGSYAGGRWQVDLSAGRPLDQRVFILPGDTVEVTLAGRAVSQKVVAMAARADVDADAVTGRAPPGTAAVLVALHREPAFFDAPADWAVQTLAPGRDGAFSASFDGADLGPGYWGEAAAVSADGHLQVHPFAPPQVTLFATEAYALIRHDPPAGDLVLVTRDALGTDRFNSGPAYPLGGSAYAVSLIEGGNLANGAYRPAPGEVVLLRSGDETAPVGRVPRLLTNLDRAGARLWGHAPAGARLALSLDADGDAGEGAPVATVAHADAQGRFEHRFGQPPGEGATGRATVWEGGHGVASSVAGGVTELVVRLYGDRLAGSLAGWGDVRVEHWSGDERFAWTQAQADPTGGLVADLRSSTGKPSVFRPGDRLRLEPEVGVPLELTVPLVSAAVDAPGGRRLTGRAPAGSRLEVAIYPQAASYFSPLPYEADRLLQRAAADAAGTYLIDCATPECAMHYGLLAAHDGPASWVLEWVDQPLVGLGVDDLTSLGSATAGLPITIQPLGADGRPRATLAEVVRPQLGGGLPAWQLPLDDLYPDGMPVGERVRVTVGERVYDSVVPAMTFTADTQADRVAGLGPSFKAMVALGVARSDVNARVPSGLGTALSDLAGRWTAPLPGFDLRGGDDVEVYLFDQADLFLWWSRRGIPASEPHETPSPEPTASPAPKGGRVHLPVLGGSGP